ncbi:hypothetical protein LIA77_00308 [Sarocladium implicatum]|jgi:hypothetical protein|nr:hypothetical protein LIA77_00308 [Sarocladium implicatum]
MVESGNRRRNNSIQKCSRLEPLDTSSLGPTMSSHEREPRAYTSVLTSTKTREMHESDTHTYVADHCRSIRRHRTWRHRSGRRRSDLIPRSSKTKASLLARLDLQDKACDAATLQPKRSSRSTKVPRSVVHEATGHMLEDCVELGLPGLSRQEREHDVSARPEITRRS